MANKLLILYLSCGAGHGQAALALREAAQNEKIWDEIQCLDVAQFYANWFRWVYHESYLSLVRHAPSIASWIWRREPVPNGREVWTFPPTLIRHGASRFFDFIQRLQPSAVISTEISGCELLTFMPPQQRQRLTSLATLIDFGLIYPVWLNKAIDIYCVPTAWEQKRLQQMGVPAHLIAVTGIPVAPQFARGNRRIARRELGLPAHRPIVLFMAGALTGKILVRAVQSSLRAVDALHVVLAGSNPANARRLRAIKHKNLRVVEWTDRVAQWMVAADLLVSKPGGMTLAEAMATGIPMVLFRPLGCWEHANLRFAVQQGAALAADFLSDLGQTISDLLLDRSRRDRMSAAARRVACPSAASHIVRLASDPKERYALAT